MSILDKMKKAGAIKSYSLESSVMYNDNDTIPTDIPILNIAFSGDIDGGFTPGLTILAGPSRHYKCFHPDTEIEVYTIE
jgi:hypothetical protein